MASRLIVYSPGSADSTKRWAACQHFHFVIPHSLACLFICLLAYLREIARLNFTKSSAHVVLAVARSSSGAVCDTLCTSGFADDVMFADHGNFPCMSLVCKYYRLFCTLTEVEIRQISILSVEKYQPKTFSTCQNVVLPTRSKFIGEIKATRAGYLLRVIHQGAALDRGGV